MNKKLKEFETMEHVAVGYSKLHRGESTDIVMANVLKYLMEYDSEQIMALGYSLEVKHALLDFQNELRAEKNRSLFSLIQDAETNSNTETETATRKT